MELWCKAREEGDAARQDWCMRYVHEIRMLEIEQLDDATAYLLQYIEKQESNNHSQVYMTWGQQNDDIKVGFWGHLQSKGFRAKQIDHQKIQITLEMPKSIALQSMGHCIGVRAVYTSYDCAYGKDPSQMSVGGMIRVDLLSIPPFSKKVKGWTIRQVPPPGQELMRLPYPNNEHATTNTAIAVQPCKVEYKVPANMLVGKSPTISWWDCQEEKWATEGISEISWEAETRKISFWTARLVSFAITQPRHLDLPYKHWVLRPIAPLLVELKITAARYDLSFIISEDGLRLKGPDEPELHDLMFAPPEEANNPEAGGTGAIQHGPGGSTKAPRIRSPATLLKELRECGLNLMPEDGDADYLDGYTPKCPETQARAYSDLSEIAAFYDIASSHHNKSLPRERALLRVRENPLYDEFDALDPDCDTDYQAIMFFPDKACFVQSLEQVSPCKEALKPGHLTHASLYLCYDKVPVPSPNHVESLQKLEVTCSNARFVEAVRQTMQLMRLLCFV